jgi:hypothetical protein
VRDPLQPDRSPFEVLGVAFDATADEVKRAARDAMKRGVDAGELQRSWAELLDPGRRAEATLFEYHPERLATMAPPSSDPAVLGLPARSATAAAWEEQLKERFPDDSALHCLAVLWYWTAYHLGQSGPEAAEAWRRVIAYWSPILASPDLCAALSGIDVPQADLVAKAVESGLREQLPTGDGDLDAVFTAEVAAARALHGRGVTVRDRAACSGPLLLEIAGLQNSVRERLAELPGDQTTRELRQAFSPYAPALVLIKERRFDEALSAADRLGTGRPQEGDLISVRIEALIGRASHRADIERIPEALDDLIAATTMAVSDAHRGAIREAVVGICRQHVAQLPDDRADEAVLALEKAMRVEPGVGPLLADRLERRALVKFRAVELIGADPDLAAAVRHLQAVVADLQVATNLGSTTAAASSQLVRASLAILEAAGAERGAELRVAHVETHVGGTHTDAEWSALSAALDEATSAIRALAASLTRPNALPENLIEAERARAADQIVKVNHLRTELPPPGKVRSMLWKAGRKKGGT